MHTRLIGLFLIVIGGIVLLATSRASTEYEEIKQQVSIEEYFRICTTMTSIERASDYIVKCNKLWMICLQGQGLQEQMWMCERLVFLITHTPM